MTDIVIIGAGPYGLSLAAHLKAQNVDFRVFGPAMDTWLNHMPKDMKLKSEGFASGLYDPDGKFTLETYCREKNIPYQDIGLPVPLDVFASYGLEFQRRFVPNLENKLAVSVTRDGERFRILFNDGETVIAKKVVMAVGLSYFPRLPQALTGLPDNLLAHSSRYGAVDHLKGREVAVVGSGASALDLTAILHRIGAKVHVVARKPQIRFQDEPNLDRPLLDRIKAPMTGIGMGWRCAFCATTPLLFRLLPEEIRLKAVQKMLGPAPCWFTREEVAGKVPFHVGVEVQKARPTNNNRITLELVDRSGAKRELEVDHVIAATGYKVGLSRISLFGKDLVSQISAVEDTPILSSNFESSVPGLYFVGITSANSFGPLLRFAVGAGFASKRLSNHLIRISSRRVVQDNLQLTAKTES